MNAPAMAFNPGKEEIERFVSALFCHADPETFISLRAFDQNDRGKPPILIEGVRIGEGSTQIIAKASRAVIRAANGSSPGVFAPPVATFTNARTAAAADIANGVAISVEIDAGDPESARRKLEHLLGPVTIAMHSGSEWADPETGEIYPKAHLHWRLSEPTRTPEEHALLKRARWAAAVLVGADMTAVPPNHPLRWPGSWNCKRAPRMAKISIGNLASEVHLQDALDKLEEAVEAAGLNLDTGPHTTGADPEARTDKVRSALAAIPNDNLAWDEWNRIGLAAWRATGGSTDGMLAWADWSAKCAKHDDEACRLRWEHFATSPPSRIGAGTLFYLAKQAGWEWAPPVPQLDFAPRTDEDVRLYGEYVSALPPEKTIPKQPPGKALPFKLFDEIEANLDALDFVEGVLIEGAMSVVYGESNSGKTFWMTDIALHVAAGMPWNGRAVEQGGVLYLALEGSFGIYNRVAAFKQKHGLEDARIPFAVVTVSLNLLDPTADASSVIETVKAVAEAMQCQMKLIVVDTLARAISGGNENASEDMGALVNTGDMIRQATGAHLSWIHHSGKEQAKGARGHSNLRGATDTEIEITAEGNDRQAEVKKQRDMPKGDVFRFNLEVIELGTNRRGKAVTSCVINPLIEEMDAPARSDRKRSLKGHPLRAFEILTNLIAASGAPGMGAPPGCSSVPEEWWRERFYDSAMAGASQGTKQRTFLRVSSELVNRHFVGHGNGRVWLVHRLEEGNAP